MGEGFRWGPVYQGEDPAGLMSVCDFVKGMESSMTDRIIELLQEEGIENYLVMTQHMDSYELFFIRKNIDMRRSEALDMTEVTVYREFDREGTHCLGNASFHVEPSYDEQEIRAQIRKAYMAAQFVPNPYYELAPAVCDKGHVSEGEDAKELLGSVTQALFAQDCEKDVFLNSAEIFVGKIRTRVVNSRGVDVAFTKDMVQGEFVAQCKSPQDVETYQDFAYDVFRPEALQELVRQTLQITRDRAQANHAPKAGVYDVILSDQYAATLFDYYKERSSGSYVYMGYSDFRQGEDIQGEPVQGDRLNLSFVATDPYSPEGLPMRDLPMVKDGVLQNLHAPCRFASYLDVKATGMYQKISCDCGEMAFEQMRQKPGLYVVNFSDFQMDSLGGYFGGEIRLAYLNDGETITPVTGGSVNGSIMEAQKDFIFSREKQNSTTFEGPKAVLLHQIRVAGAQD